MYLPYRAGVDECELYICHYVFTVDQQLEETITTAMPEHQTYKPTSPVHQYSLL